MTVSGKILNFAIEHGGQFTRQELLRSFILNEEGVPQSTVVVTLNRMVAHKDILRTSRGTYQMAGGKKQEFAYPINRFLRRINNHVKAHFPFVCFCLWQPSVLSQFMQHVPAMQITLIDVERIAMGALFDSLRASNVGVPILLNPSKQDCERYINNNEVIIVRPLVREAPIANIDGCLVSTLEKMLVDAINDKELAYMQGSELYTIYANALRDYDVNVKRLLRYASRRNRKEKIKEILKTVSL